MVNIFAQLSMAWALGIVLGAMVVVGALEWVKGYFLIKGTEQNKVPGWGWRVVLCGVCVVVSITAGGGISWIALDAIALLAVAQIGYPVLVKLPLTIIGGVEKKAQG